MTELLSDLLRFKSHKVVHAKLMDSATYRSLYEENKVYRMGRLGISEVNVAGVLVVYSKDTPDQYFSWCPVAQFRDGNTKFPEPTSHPENPYDNACWGVHVSGPDSVMAAKSFEEATEQCARINANIAYITKPESNSPNYPLMWAKVDLWENISKGIHDPESTDWSDIA